MTRLEETCKRLYNEFDYNCAETVLHAADEVYGLGISEDGFNLIGTFGGGCGAGHLCGAIAAGAAVIGRLRIETVAHACDVGEVAKGYINKCIAEMGSTMCAYLKPRYFNESERCLPTILLAARILDEVVSGLEK